MRDDQEAGGTIPALFALVPFAMAMLIFGAQLGVIPADDGVFFAPPPVITALWLGLLLFSFVVAIPRQAPAWLRTLMGLALMLLVGVVCNWTAFAPGVRYTSTTSIGPFSSSGEDPIGGRIVFGLAALVVDAILIGSLAYWARWAWRRIRHS
jgi:hypothetical protein